MEWIEARPIIALRLGISEEALGLYMDEVFEEVKPDDQVRITIQDEDFSLSIDGASYKRFITMTNPWAPAESSVKPDIIVSASGIGFDYESSSHYWANKGIKLKATMFDGPISGYTINRDKVDSDKNQALIKSSELSRFNGAITVDVEDLWTAETTFTITKPVVFIKNLKVASATSARVKFTETNGKLVMIAFNGGLKGEVFRVIYDKNEVEINSAIESEEETPSFDAMFLNKLLQPTCRKGELSLLVSPKQLTIKHRSGTTERIHMSATLDSL
ncbi:hypothetical protein N9E35_01445 [Candidatus Marinimicrobia bacterium]|nr:hypothetical protein [Candidatus Neomarinimicrobiota bacterium]